MKTDAVEALDMLVPPASRAEAERLWHECGVLADGWQRVSYTQWYQMCGQEENEHPSPRDRPIFVSAFWANRRRPNQDRYVICLK